MNKLIAYSLLILALGAGCNNATKNYTATDAMATEEVQADQTSAAQSAARGYEKAAAAPPQQQVEKKVIKEGELAFETGNIAETKKKLLELTRSLGGYIETESQQKDDYSKNSTYSMTVRMPAQNFEKLVDGLTDQASHIDNKSIRSTDVTTQYIDIKTRLETKKALEQRYLELLKKAGRMEDILSIEGKLAEVRSDIESTQGQFNYLSKQVAYSTLTVSFYTKALVEGDGFFHKLKNAFSTGFDVLAGLFFGMIAIWPIILILLIVIWFLRRYWKKRRGTS